MAGGWGAATSQQGGVSHIVISMSGSRRMDSAACVTPKATAATHKHTTAYVPLTNDDAAGGKSGSGGGGGGRVVSKPRRVRTSSPFSTNSRTVVYMALPACHKQPQHPAQPHACL